MLTQRKSCSRKSHHGIEIVNNLQWEQWEPGGEYTQKLVLKNVNMNTKKLKYRFPNSQFFTTRYPQPITLSSGTSISLPVTFRPLMKDKYEEYIEFTTKDGCFKIPMKASLPKAQLKLPECINFGMCAVQDHVSMKFEVTNVSDLHVKFLLKSDEVFALSPTSGTLAPNTHAQISVTFKPQGAFVYEVDALCFFGTEIEYSNPVKIKFEGIGKYPHLVLRHGQQTGHEVVLDFGEHAVGGTHEKTINIQNIVPINAPFQVLQKSQGLSIDNPFQCSLYHGVIKAGQTTKVQFSFSPELTDIEYVEHFEILSVGLSSKAIVKCVGKGIGPKILFEVKSVNFGSTKARDSITRSFKLKNVSSVSAVYQFQIDRGSTVFNLDHLSGIIEAKATKTIIAIFSPKKPIAYYKKLVCLVHNQGPIIIDLFGSCFTNEIKPVVLTRQHIERNTFHENRGLSKVAPEDLLSLLNENKIAFDELDTLHVIDDELEKTLEKNIELGPYQNFFNDGSMNEELLNTPHVSLEDRCIDFGNCVENCVIQKSINVTNHTSGKITCVWMNSVDSHFTVVPEEADINAKSSTSFRIVFRPTATSKFYWSELEAYAFYKSMREHQLVNEKLIIPPWCLNLKVSANTFPKQKETFVPSVDWDSTCFTFPPVTPKLESSYRTCIVKNRSSNVAHFSFQESAYPEFTCKPQMAYVQSNDYQVFIFRINSMSNTSFKNKINCTMNYSPKFKQDIELYLTVETPQVVLSPEDFVYFKPTCIGSYSVQTTSVKNISRFPLRLQWKISTSDENVLKVDPLSCVILPNETQTHKWEFSPSEISDHFFKVRLFAYIDGSESFYNRYELGLLGTGQYGSITCDKTSVSFGGIVVGESANHIVTLCNDTDCCLKYKLLSHQTVSTFQLGYESHDQPLVISLDHDEFLLPSKSSKKLKINVRPRQRAFYQCKVSYKLVSHTNHGARIEDIEADLCSVTVQGVYPSIIINDILGQGCLQHYSKKTLWELFHVDNFNTLIEDDPANSELRYGMHSRHSTNRRLPETTAALNDFNFSSSVFGSIPSIICINLHNNTESLTEWILRYPADLQLEFEDWADTGELDPEELHELYVADSKLFEIQPMSGIIKPGQSQVLTCIYRHESIGIHKIPVLFKIKKGRELKVNLIGQTLPPDISELYFISKKHIFNPVSIGCLMPPIQSYKLYNGSSQLVRFAFDLSNLDELRKENYDWRVLECLTPMGEIPPFEYVDTKWLFAPIEVKCYELIIPVHVENGEAYDVTFSGSGYDPNMMGDTMKVIDDENQQVKYIKNGPDDLIEMSKESISFSHIPLFYEVCEILFVKNISEVYDVSFYFHLEHTSAEGLVSIYPRHGVLSPGEIKVCKVKLFSEGPAAIHDFDIICEAKNETLSLEYETELRKWQADENEKKHLFTIRDIYDTPSVHRSLSANTKKLKSISNGTVTTASDGDIRRYETLPPIRVKERKPERILIEETPVEGEDNAPIQPKSVLHHLAIFAQTHSMFEYEELLPDAVEKCFIQRSTLKEPSSGKPDRITVEESRLLENVLTMIVKDCLDDRHFIHSIKRLKDEHIPYFAMLSADKPRVDDITRNDSLYKTTDVLNVEENVESHCQVLKTSLPKESSHDCSEIDIIDSDDVTRHSNDIMGESNTENERKDFDAPSNILLFDSLHENLFQRQELKKNDEFRYIIHDVLENTIFNLLNEATYGEISLTNRPRLIALPPSSAVKQDN